MYTIEGQLPTLFVWHWLGLLRKADSGEGPGAPFLSVSWMGFSASGQQAGWPLTASLNCLYHIAADENSLHVLAIQFLFLCYFLCVCFFKCVVLYIFSGKLEEIETGTILNQKFFILFINYFFAQHFLPDTAPAWMCVDGTQHQNHAWLLIPPLNNCQFMCVYFATFLTWVIALTF